MQPQTLARTMTTAMLLALGLIPASPADRRAESACDPPPRSETLLRNGVAVVYREPDTRASYGDTVRCDLGMGNPIAIDSPPDGSFAFRPPAMALAAHTLGYSVETLDNDSNAYTVVWVVDVRKDRGLAQPQRRRVETDSKVGSLVVRPRGAVAWITCRTAAESTGKFRRACSRPGAFDRVYRWPAGRKRPELLDRGRTIDPSSLRRRGGVISWRRGGRTRRARLSDG